MPLAHTPSLARGQVTPLVSQRGQRKCQTRPVRSEAMPLDALDDSGQPVRVLEGGPRRASCAECGVPMRAGTGSVRIWHWAHLVHNPRCKAARETEWHLAGKVLAWPGGRAPRHRPCPQPRPSTVREHGRHHALWDWGHRNARSSADLDGWRLLSDRQPRRADRVVPCSSIARICR